MESTSIVIKKQSEISANQERKFRKLGFENYCISKSTLYFLVNFLPHCVPAASGSPDFAIQKL